MSDYINERIIEIMKGKYGKKKGAKNGAKSDNFASKNSAFKKLMQKGGYKCCGVDGKKMK